MATYKLLTRCFYLFDERNVGKKFIRVELRDWLVSRTWMKLHEATSHNTGHRAKSVLSCCIDIMAKLVDDANGSALRHRKMELEKEPETKSSEGKRLAMLEQRSGVKLLGVCFVGIFVSYFIYALLQEKMWVNLSLSLPFYGWCGCLMSQIWFDQKSPSTMASTLLCQPSMPPCKEHLAV